MKLGIHLIDSALETGDQVAAKEATQEIDQMICQTMLHLKGIETDNQQAD